MQGRWHWELRIKPWQKRVPTDLDFLEFNYVIDGLQQMVPEIEENQRPRGYLGLQTDRAARVSARGFLHRKRVIGIPCDHD